MDYRMLCAQARSLAEAEGWYVALMANASALLWEALPDINWAGFYIVRDGALTLGTMLVPDVHAFPGHIACDSASNAEIVIPLRDAAGEVKAVLDIDSPVFNRFTEMDREGLEAFAREIERAMKGLEA